MGLIIIRPDRDLPTCSWFPGPVISPCTRTQRMCVCLQVDQALEGAVTCFDCFEMVGGCAPRPPCGLLPGAPPDSPPPTLVLPPYSAR
jgi:hypothetical protein